MDIYGLPSIGGLVFMKRSLPFQLIVVLLFSLFLGRYVPTVVKEVCYGLSLSIKELLVFVLPVIVFSYLFSCILGLRKGALGFILTLLACICLSGFTSNWIAYGFGNLLVHSFGLGSGNAVVPQGGLHPYWILALPKWISNDFALLFSAAMGCFFAYFPHHRAEKVAQSLKGISDLFLGRFFIPIVPLFILGFALKLQDDGILFQLFKVYGPLFVLIAMVAGGYIGFLYAVAARFNFSRWIEYVKNALPSLIAGFSTMSSAASMPMTIEGAEKNTGKSEAVRSIVPATVNVHLIGDSIAVPLMAFVILNSFGKVLPGMESYLTFSFYFILAKFAIAAVPGGGIIVMLPVLERCLGFSTEMLSLITALYIIFDPVITASNVFGNGAFAVLFTQFFYKK